MIEKSSIDPLDAWRDCFEMTLKHRMKVVDAKSEIQRAWALWKRDKGGHLAKLEFYGWLKRHRPYSLTSCSQGDSWQRVNAWLLQYERAGEQP
jgi:hypothetical protein